MVIIASCNGNYNSPSAIHILIDSTLVERRALKIELGADEWGGGGKISYLAVVTTDPPM